MKNSTLLYGAALVASMVIGAELYAQTITNIVQYCTGDSAVCTQKAKVTPNAIGDLFELDVSRYPVKFLGKISEEKALMLAMPAAQGEQVVYSFIPTTGDYAGQLVYIVFDYLKSRPGTPIAGKSTVMGYRRLQSAPATQWTEIATITFLAKNLKLEPISLTFKPDGTAVWINVNTKTPEVFLFGRKDLTEARRAEAAQKATEIETAAKGLDGAKVQMQKPVGLKQPADAIPRPVAAAAA